MIAFGVSYLEHEEADYGIYGKLVYGNKSIKFVKSDGV
jgi:hypothetical protein